MYTAPHIYICIYTYTDIHLHTYIHAAKMNFNSIGDNNSSDRQITQSRSLETLKF